MNDYVEQFQFSAQPEAPSSVVARTIQLALLTNVEHASEFDRKEVQLALLTLRIALRNATLANSVLQECGGAARLWAICWAIARPAFEASQANNVDELSEEACKCCVNIAESCPGVCFPHDSVENDSALALAVPGLHPGRLVSFPILRLLSQCWKQRHKQGVIGRTDGATAEGTFSWEDGRLVSDVADFLDRCLVARGESSSSTTDNNRENDPQIRELVLTEAFRVAFCICVRFGTLTPSPSNPSEREREDLHRICLACRAITTSAKEVLRDLQEFSINVLSTMPLSVTKRAIEGDTPWIEGLVGVFESLIKGWPAHRRQILEDVMTPLLVLETITRDQTTARVVEHRMLPRRPEGWSVDSTEIPPEIQQHHIGRALVDLLMETNQAVKHYTTGLLLNVCDGDERLLTRRIGFGSAAGLLRDRGLLAQVQAEIRAQQQGETSDEEKESDSNDEFVEVGNPPQSDEEEAMLENRLRRLAMLEQAGLVKIVRKGD